MRRSAAFPPGGFLQVVETGIYVDDLAAAEEFYCGLLGLRRVSAEPGRHLFAAAGGTMLLVFSAAETLKGETLPAHGARGSGHFALEVEGIADLERWRRYLLEQGVSIEQDVQWGRPDLRSIYFRDPAGNSVEIITRGVWPLTGC